MAERSFLSALHKLWVGFTLRCPNCEQSHMFHGLFKMDKTCPVCGVRYERMSGESVGGMFINLVTAELLSVGGYIATQLLWTPPLWLQVSFWIVFSFVFVLVFYRHSRSLWVAVAYLTGGVYAD